MLQLLELELPGLKGYSDDEGSYHVAFSLSTTDMDSYGNIFSKTALKSMVERAKKININANHRRDLEGIIGPVADAWLETEDETTYLWVDVRVRREWEPLLQDLVTAGTRLGGSLEVAIDTSTMSKDENGRNIIMDAFVTGGAITGVPANQTTFGTLQTVKNGCPGSTCQKNNNNNNNSHLKLDNDHLKDKIHFLLRNIEKEELKLKKEENTEFNDVDIKKGVFHDLIEYLKKQLELLTGKEEPTEKNTPQEEANLSLEYETSYDPPKKQVETEKLHLENEILVKELESSKKQYKESLEQVEFLKNKNAELESQLQQKEHIELVKKALELNHKLNPDSSVNNEESLISEIRSHFKLEEGVDMDSHLQNYVKIMELSLKKMPHGSIPQTHGNELHLTSKNVYDKKIQRLERKISKMGQKEGED